MIAVCYVSYLSLPDKNLAYKKLTDSFKQLPSLYAVYNSFIAGHTVA